MPGRTRAAAARMPAAVSMRKPAGPAVASGWKIPVGMTEKRKTTERPAAGKKRAFQEKRRTSAFRTIRGTPPATAPRKKYSAGTGYRSISARSGLAKRIMPRPPPREKSERKARLSFLCFMKELTEETSRS